MSTDLDHTSTKMPATVLYLSSDALDPWSAQRKIDELTSRIKSLEHQLKIVSAGKSFSFLTEPAPVSPHESKRPRNPFRQLPKEMHLFFFHYLDYVDLYNTSLVCKDWSHLAKDEGLWQSYFVRAWRDGNSDSKGKWKVTREMPRESWKSQFERRLKVQRNWVEGKPNVSTLSQHTGTVTCLKFDANNRLISGSDDGSLVLWELSSPPERTVPLFQQHHNNTKLTHRVNSFVGHGGPVWCLDLQGDVLVSGSYDKTIKVWSVKQGTIRCTLRGHTNWVSSLQVHDDTIVSGSWDACLKLWRLKETESDSKEEKKLETKELKEESTSRGLAGECVSTLVGEVGNVIYCHQWDPKTNVLATGTRRQTVQVWDLHRSEITRSFTGHSKQVYCLQFDSNKIVSGSGDHTIKVWDPKSGECAITLTGHANPVMCLQFDDAYKMISGGYDKTVKVWDMRSTQVVSTLEGHSAAIFCLQFDTDKVITGSADKHIKVWDFNKYNACVSKRIGRGGNLKKLFA